MIDRSTVDKQLFVVFGATGDLMQRKLLPALYHLIAKGPLAGRSTILGVARGGEFNDEKYRAMARKTLVEEGLLDDEGARKWCDDCIHYQPIDRGDLKDYQDLFYGAGLILLLIYAPKGLAGLGNLMSRGGKA